MKFLSFCLAFCFTLLQTLFFLNQITAQFDPDCDVPDLKSEFKIGIGQGSSNNAGPWMASLFYKNRFHCGGSIIAPDFILTAAHCVNDDPDISNYKFIYGTNNLNLTQNESNSAFVAKIIIHPDYFSTIKYNDIALIKLTKKINFSDKVKPICLPSKEKLDENEYKSFVNLLKTGWSKTNGNSTVRFQLDWIKRVVTDKPSQPSVSKKCGVSIQKKIIGGKESKTNAWPWIVQIRFWVDDYLNYPFSGSLISNQHVLTLYDEELESNLESFFVALGSNELKLEPDEDELYSVISFETISDELVVLKLHRPVTNRYVSPICLPNSRQSSLIYNKQITTAGWGSTDGTIDSLSINLRETKLTVNNRAKECREYSDTRYCTFGKKTNICYYDYGSPVMYLVNRKWTLFGLYHSFFVDENSEICLTNLMSLAINIVNEVDTIKSALY